MTGQSGGVTVVDVYADPVCPYAWIVSRWLEEVAPSRPVDLRHHVMSLRYLNAGHHQGTAYSANIDRTVGPSRVFTAAAVHVGEGIIRELYTAFGTRWFARWRRPDPEDLRDTLEAALTAVGLPSWLVHAADTDSYDGALADSHAEAVGDLGRGAGTPILHLDGVPWFGPILDSIPHGQEALDLFDALLVLTRHEGFTELRRARTGPPRLLIVPATS
ncbi:mycothiol-dependent nitroreductase Rv2466c family protein [Tessaracoccus sp. G1721]